MYKLYSDVLITKGFNRDLLIDIGRESVKLIPKQITSLIESFGDPNVTYSQEENEVIQELIENELVFQISAKAADFFPNIDVKWFNPADITNGVIEISNENIHLLREILSQFEELQCYYFTIVLIDNFSDEQYKTIFSILEASSIISYELILNYYKESTSIDILKHIAGLNNIVKTPIVFNCDSQNILSDFRDVFIFKNEIYNNKLCGCIKKENFNANLYLFSESQQFNSCLNRKLSINQNGDIKNCPSMLENFGNIKHTRLDQVFKKASFKKYWNIKKDDIAICKDCEFRHICTDCRAFLENPNDLYSKPLKCSYDPYTNVWSDSNSALKKKAIEYYGINNLIDKNSA